MEPERSSATTSARPSLRTSWRISSETGSTSSSGERWYPPRPKLARPPVTSKPPPRSRTNSRSAAKRALPSALAGTFSRITARAPPSARRSRRGEFGATTSTGIAAWRSAALSVSSAPS
jgi:hypothetical protein